MSFWGGSDQQWEEGPSGGRDGVNLGAVCLKVVEGRDCKVSGSETSTERGGHERNWAKQTICGGRVNFGGGASQPRVPFAEDGT
jgi:hypothetical protein